VIPIGGAEERTGSMRVLRRFVKLSGGRKARIVIIPTASMLADTGDRYIEVFEKIGVASAISLPIAERADADRPEYIEHLDGATGIFMTGGNQLRLSTILGGTLVAQKVRRANAAGVHVAGTSAGAAIMPEHMIAGGSMGLSARADGVNLAPGLGLTNALIIDQHFSQRDRLGRLLTAVSYNPFLLGVGNVTIIDPEHLSYSSMDRARKNESLSLLDLKLHILSKGCRFDIHERKPYPPKKR
jgi:cyanophycinase